MGLTFAVMIAEAEKLGNVGDRLVRDLRASNSLAVQGEALAAYASGVRKIADRLEKLDAPPALRPGLQSEVKRLRQLGRLASETRTALLEERQEDAREASDELARAASGAAAVTRAQRRAIREYQRRIRDLRAQEGRVEVELRRLSSDL